MQGSKGAQGRSFTKRVLWFYVQVEVQSAAFHKVTALKMGAPKGTFHEPPTEWPQHFLLALIIPVFLQL